MGIEKILSTPWTGPGARMNVFVRLSKAPALKASVPPAAFRPLIPRIWSIASGFPALGLLAAALTPSLISAETSMYQLACPPSPSFLATFA